MSNTNNTGDIHLNGPVSGAGLTIGHGNTTTTTISNTGPGAVVVGGGVAGLSDMAQVFAALTQKVNRLPEGTAKEDAQDAVRKLETEAAKAEKADERRVKSSMETLIEVLPDSWEVAVNFILNPLAGLNTAFKKIAERVKMEREKRAAP